MKQRSRGQTRGCPSKDCEAGDPRFLSYTSDEQIPNDVLEKLTAMGIYRHQLQRCSYCGVVWAPVMAGTTMYDKIVGHEGKGGETEWRV